MYSTHYLLLLTCIFSINMFKNYINDITNSVEELRIFSKISSSLYFPDLYIIRCIWITWNANKCTEYSRVIDVCRCRVFCLSFQQQENTRYFVIFKPHYIFKYNIWKCCHDCVCKNTHNLNIYMYACTHEMYSMCVCVRLLQRFGFSWVHWIRLEGIKTMLWYLFGKWKTYTINLFVCSKSWCLIQYVLSNGILFCTAQRHEIGPFFLAGYVSVWFVCGPTLMVWWCVCVYAMCMMCACVVYRVRHLELQH